MNVEYKIIEFLGLALGGLFLWVLRYRIADIDKEIAILRQENIKIKENYITVKNFNTFSKHLDHQIQRVEDSMHNRMMSMEKSISDRLDLYLRMIDSKAEREH